MSLIGVLQGFQDSDAAQAFLGSQYLYPVVEASHVLGLGLSVGLLALADLRLIGALLKRAPISDSLDTLRPWMLGGFVLMFVSGGVLFWAEAAKLYVNPVFRLKMLFMLVASINALIFEFRLAPRIHRSGDQQNAPLSAKVAAWTSLSCWALVILFGRWIAYAGT